MDYILPVVDVAELAVCVATGSLLCLGVGVFKLAEDLFGIQDPLSQILGAFSGRPTLEATIDIAKVLSGYKSPALNMMAIGAAHLVNRDIPISSPDADPIFGHYFVAARMLEDGIRWSTSDESVVNVDNETLTAALHEAGNPGVAGTLTLAAIEHAWHSLQNGSPLGGHSPEPYFKQLADSTADDAASILARGWSQAWMNAHGSTGGGTNGQTGGGSHLTPGHLPPGYAQDLGNVVQNAPPGRPILIEGVPTGKYAASWYDPSPAQLASVFPGMSLGALVTTTGGQTTGTITIGIPFNQNVAGLVELRAQFEGGPFPAAHVDWLIDGNQVGQDPAETTNKVIPITVTHQWDSRTVQNGFHQLGAKWIGHEGTLHAQEYSEIHVDNKQTGGGNGNGGQHQQLWPKLPKGDTPPPPIPPIETGEASFATCCFELLAMLFQLCEQTYFVAKNAEHEVDATAAIAKVLEASSGELGRIATLIQEIVTKLPPASEFAQLINAVNCVCTAVKESGALNLDALVHQVTRIADEQAREQPTAEVYKQILDEMVKEGTLDPGMGQIIGDALHVTIHPNPIHPVITKWLKDRGIETTPASVDWADAIVRWLKSLLGWIEKEATNFFGGAVSGAVKFGHDVEPAFKKVFSELSGFETLVPREVFDWVVNTVFNGGAPTPDNVEELALKLHGGAFMVGQGVHLLAALAGYLGYPMSSVWKSNAELMVEMLAYKEILHSFHGAFFPIAITERAKQRYNRKFHPHIPNAGMAHTGFTRGKISAAERDTLQGLNGLDPAYRAFEQALAYRAIRPQLLVRGFRNRAPDPHLLNQIIIDQGNDPQFHDALEQIIDDSCYQHLYDTFAQTAFTACEAGAMTLDELDQNLEAANWDSKARGLARTIALIARQKAIAQQTEQAAATELSGGAITEQDARSLLQAAGVDDWKVETTVAIGNARASFAAARKLQTEEQRLLKTTLAQGQAAIEQQYLSGNLNGLALTASLEAALEAYLAEYATFGASAAELANAATFGRIEIAAIVAKLNAKKHGAAVMRYGQSMSRADAQLLDLKVAEIKEAVLKEDLTPEQGFNDLVGLNIDEQYAMPLILRWKQQIAKKGTEPIQPP